MHFLQVSSFQRSGSVKLTNDPFYLIAGWFRRSASASKARQAVDNYRRGILGYRLWQNPGSVRSSQQVSQVDLQYCQGDLDRSGDLEFTQKIISGSVIKAPGLVFQLDTWDWTINKCCANQAFMWSNILESNHKIRISRILLEYKQDPFLGF